jgi:hypothetical protein
MKKKKPLNLLLIGIFSLALTVSCNEDNTQDQSSIDEEVFDPNSSLNTIFDGKIFSIPSPIQTAYLIKQLDLPFDATLLIDNSNDGEYVTEYKQALNLGMYGTDLGYSTLYDQKSTTMKYLTSVEKLTTELGLEAAFDTSFLSYFEENHQEDSLILLMSDAFRKADNFLKRANRKSTSALILTGGWIESLNIACQLNEKKSSPEIERRIGEQKRSLNSIIAILKEYNNEDTNAALIVEMESLKESFDKVKMTYEYAAPETNAEKSLTTFNHKLDIEIDKSVLQEIKTKIAQIRSNIIKV